MNLTIGQSMKSCRQALGVTQKQLAERAGVSAQLVWTAEADYASPSILAVEAMAGALGVSIDDYIHGGVTPCHTTNGDAKRAYRIPQ